MASDETTRLFLALWPDAGARAELRAWRDAARWPANARLTRARDLHLTLHYLGPVHLAAMTDVTCALAVPCQPIALTLDRMAIWRGGAGVLLTRNTPDTLAALHSALADVLHRIALPVEARLYRPHVTLARRGQGAVFGTPPAVEWHSAGYALVESIGDGGGYRIVQRYC